MVRELLKKGWSGKVILMSATLDRALTHYFPKFATYFVGVQRPFPVKVVCIDQIETLEVSPHPWQRSANQKLSQLAGRLPFKTGGIPKPGIENKVHRFVAYCALAYGKVGTSTLVFLPGMVEIATLHDIRTQIVLESGLSFIDVFVLHSQIPLEDQSNAFVAPAPDRMNILLATNLAESSVTIPSLRLVKNTASQQYSHFDSVQQVSVLRKMWASKAACSQRAGREFPGVVIHTIPRSLYTLLPDFSKPEMSTAALDKLYLSARNIGPLFGIKSPSRFLQLAPSPPMQAKLTDAVEYLAEVGALVSTGGQNLQN